MDVTREVPLEVEYGGRGKDPWGNERVGFTATASPGSWRTTWPAAISAAS